MQAACSVHLYPWSYLNVQRVCLPALPPLRNESNALRVIVADVEMNGVGSERTIARGECVYFYFDSL